MKMEPIVVSTFDKVQKITRGNGHGIHENLCREVSFCGVKCNGWIGAHVVLLEGMLYVIASFITYLYIYDIKIYIPHGC